MSIYIEQPWGFLQKRDKKLITFKYEATILKSIKSILSLFISPFPLIGGSIFSRIPLRGVV